MQPVVSWPGWEFVRKLGAGSYGAVYEIRQQVGSLERRAALKVIPVPRDENELNDLYSQGFDDETIERSLREQIEDVVREFSVMLDLRECRNIVHCEDLRIVDRPEGEKGKDICMQMELLTPLTRALKPGEESSQVIRVARDMLNALAFCREKKIVHRDIKPQNIFVSPEGYYKLGDFGVAKTMDRTGSATMIGTLNYMAPEVHSGAHYGSGADVYSLGLVLYWLLNERRLPFVPILDRPAKQSEVEQAASRRFRGEALPPPKHGSEMLKSLVCAMCAYRAEDRPDAETLRAQFRALSEPDAFVYRPQPQPTPAPQPRPEPMPNPEPEEDGTIGIWGAGRSPVQPAQKPVQPAPKPDTELDKTQIEPDTQRAETQRELAKELLALGEQYYYGEGVKHDYSKAAKLFLRAAKLESAQAQYMYAKCCATGIGVRKSMSSAAKWYQRAADGGHLKAQEMLGYCYENGLGVARSLRNAVAWYQTSAKGGNASAAKELRRLGRS